MDLFLEQLMFITSFKIKSQL